MGKVTVEWKKDGGSESNREFGFEEESETSVERQERCHPSQKHLHTSLLHSGRGQYKSIAHKRKATYKLHDHITQKTPFIYYLPQVNPETALAASIP